MAFASDSTTAPARPLLPLPALDRRAIGRDGWARARESAAQLGGAVRDHVAAGMRQAWQAARGLLPTETPQPAAGPVPANDTPLLPLPAPLPSLTAALSRRRAIFGTVAVDEPDTAAEARRIHLRRQLVQAAEHGTALLSSLDLPRLVTPDFVPVDRVAIGEAVDRAIAALDAMDGDTDLEDGADDEGSLGWERPGSQGFLSDGTFCDDRELDTADYEPSLASPERHPDVPVVTWGRSWTARGGGEGQLRWAEGGQHDRELDPCDGPQDDDELDGAGEVDGEPSIGWPEDFTAEVVFTFSAEGDAEHDDVDAEPDERHGSGAWVFGPSRREVAHV